MVYIGLYGVCILRRRFEYLFSECLILSFPFHFHLIFCFLASACYMQLKKGEKVRGRSPPICRRNLDSIGKRNQFSEVQRIDERLK